MPVEHTEWVGDRYEGGGLDGQRIALVLFSHWGDVGDDHAGFTNDIIRGLMKGERERALDMIQFYFADPEPARFWPKVVFFNFIPDMVGDAAGRYGWGTTDQHKRGLARFKRILTEHCPQKIIVFSTKAWGLLDAPCEGAEQQLGEEFPSTHLWGTFEASGHRALVFKLRHPQGASTALMTRAVRHILKLPQASV